jgi:hypothetical protein
MPLSEKDSKKLITDLAKYIEQDKWTKQDIGKLEEAGKITKEDADFLRKKQSQANRKRDKLEQEITKTIVTRFPARFGKPRGEKKEEAKKEIKEVVVPKEEPEVLEIKRGVLERINDTLALQADYFHAFEGVAKEQLESFNIVKEIAEEERAQHEEINEIIYPTEGGEKTIPAGMTALDLWTGDATLGDGTEDVLSDALMRIGQLYIRSLYIDCNKKFTVQLDGKGTHTIAADDFFSRKGIQCQRVFIDVDESTKLKFWSSTNPDATIEEMRNVVVTGVETPLASRQAYWHYRTSFDLNASEIATLTISEISENVRFVLDTITVSCQKSCIQILEFTIAVPNKTVYWRERRYDSQGDFEFKNTILNAGEQLKFRVYNDTNETLTFHLEVLGLAETI